MRPLALLSLLLAACGGGGTDDPTFVGDGPEDPGPFAGGDAGPAGVARDPCTAACANIAACSDSSSGPGRCVEECQQAAPPPACLACYADAPCGGFDACDGLCQTTSSGATG